MSTTSGWPEGENFCNHHIAQLAKLPLTACDQCGLGGTHRRRVYLRWIHCSLTEWPPLHCRLTHVTCDFSGCRHTRTAQTPHRQKTSEQFATCIAHSLRQSVMLIAVARSTSLSSTRWDGCGARTSRQSQHRMVREDPGGIGLEA